MLSPVLIHTTEHINAVVVSCHAGTCSNHLCIQTQRVVRSEWPDACSSRQTSNANMVSIWVLMPHSHSLQPLLCLVMHRGCELGTMLQTLAACPMLHALSCMEFACTRLSFSDIVSNIVNAAGTSLETYHSETPARRQTPTPTRRFRLVGRTASGL